MDAIRGASAAYGDDRAIRFTGTWREFMPIAASNLLLTIVTLGVYRFWAKARERRYLWSNTILLDDALQWTGTGKEMLIGFVIAMPLFLPLLALIGWGLPRIAKQGNGAVVVGAAVAAYMVFFNVLSFARFRALRYRLSRTWWHGIRGGSDASGLGYAGRAFGWYAASFLSAGIFYPWCHVRLWNNRWRSMSIGSLPFGSELTTRPIRLSWAITWICFAIGNALLLLFAVPGMVVYGPGAPQLIVPLLIYAVTGIAYLSYQSSFYRAALDWLSLGDVGFTLDADVSDWLEFYLKTAALTVATLGLAIFFYQYRRWKFITSRLEIHGTADLLEMKQSSTAGPRGAEGFADAFDIGAF